MNMFPTRAHQPPRCGFGIVLRRMVCELRSGTIPGSAGVPPAAGHRPATWASVGDARAPRTSLTGLRFGRGSGRLGCVAPVGALRAFGPVRARGPRSQDIAPKATPWAEVWNAPDRLRADRQCNQIHIELTGTRSLRRRRGARPSESAARTLQGQAYRLPAAHPGAGARRQRLRAPLAGLPPGTIQTGDNPDPVRRTELTLGRRASALTKVSSGVSASG